MENNSNKSFKIYFTGDTNNYVNVEPNAHYWGSLESLLNNIKLTEEADKMFNNGINLELKVKYLFIGLENTIKNGYILKCLKDNKFDFEQFKGYHIFTSIESARYYLMTVRNIVHFNSFVRIIENTIEAGYNLIKINNNMEREQVYKRIDQERNYQDVKWKNNDVPDDEKSIAEWLNYIEFHLGKAKNEIYYLKHQEALAEVRKIAALAVKCMEVHGCPERNIDNYRLGSKKTNNDGCCGDECECKK